jgi:anti-sigma factor RsiW
MNCILTPTEQENLLLGYSSAGLDAATSQAYERHLAGCEQCRTLLELQRQLDESLTDWEAPAISPDFDQKLFARIHAEQAAPLPWWKDLSVFGFGWKPLATAAVALLALVVFLTWTPEPAPIAQQADTVRAEELAEVEKSLDDFEALQALHLPETAAETASGEKESL